MPFYVTVEIHSTEGQVVNVEDKVKEVKEDIVVALGLSRSLVTGDGPNFATASVSLQKMLVMIWEIKQAARDILAWVFDDWLEKHSRLGRHFSKYGISATMSLPVTDEVSAHMGPDLRGVLLGLVEVYQRQERWQDAIAVRRHGPKPRG